MIYEEAIYRKVWKKHVIEDVNSYLDGIGITLTDEDVDKVAQMYVYEGDYDCNLSYWQNLENLIREVYNDEVCF